MSAIDLSSYFGLGAISLLTLNILIGVLLSTKYNPVRRWPHRRINTLKLHNWTGYAALAFMCIVAVIVAICFRVSWQLRQPPPRTHRTKQSRALAR